MKFDLLHKDKEQIIKDGNIDTFNQLQPQGKVFDVLEDIDDYYKIVYDNPC